MRRPICECCECGTEIEKQDDYYCYNGEFICTECAAQYAVELMQPFLVKGCVPNGW